MADRKVSLRKGLKVVVFAYGFTLGWIVFLWAFSPELRQWMGCGLGELTHEALNASILSLLSFVVPTAILTKHYSNHETYEALRGDKVYKWQRNLIVAGVMLSASIVVFGLTYTTLLADYQIIDATSKGIAFMVEPFEYSPASRIANFASLGSIVATFLLGFEFFRVNHSTAE